MVLLGGHNGARGTVVEQDMRIGLFSDVHSNLAGLQAVANEFEMGGELTTSSLPAIICGAVLGRARCGGC